MERSIQDEVREIKKSLRLSMNGVVSTLQRRQGLDYKINFGVELPRLKGIAGEHPRNKELAVTLWQENIRECKILAILLMPQEGYREVADKWAGEARFTEIADLLCMHMLCKMPDAPEKALQWSTDSNGMYRYCGYRTIAHLLRKGYILDARQEEAFFNSLIAQPCGKGESVTANCAHNTAMLYLDDTPGAAERLRKAIEGKKPGTQAVAMLLKDFEE